MPPKLQRASLHEDLDIVFNALSYLNLHIFHICLHIFCELYIRYQILIIIDDDKKMIQSIKIIFLEEMEHIFKGMSNLRSADEDGIAVEMIEYANIEFKDALVTVFNQILMDGTFDES